MHQTLIKVRFNEIDPYGHVNHSVYLHYFEEARVAAMDGMGQSIDVLLSQGFSIVVAQIETKFKAPSYLSDQLLMERGISEIKRASAVWIQRASKDGSLIATQKTRVGCVDPDGNPCKFPEELSKAIQTVPVPADWIR